MRKHSLQLLGYFFVLLGIIGTFLPILPTVPFIIAAAWCFSRSHPAYYTRLKTHPRFGKLLNDWETHRIVPKRIKWLSTIMLACSLSITTFLLGIPFLWLTIPTIIICFIIFIWIWRLPDH